MEQRRAKADQEIAETKDFRAKASEPESWILCRQVDLEIVLQILSVLIVNGHVDLHQLTVEDWIHVLKVYRHIKPDPPGTTTFEDAYLAHEIRVVFMKWMNGGYPDMEKPRHEGPWFLSCVHPFDHLSDTCPVSRLLIESTSAREQSQLSIAYKSMLVSIRSG